jgi:Fuc2NAc and GlcNAc transferase
LPPPLGFEQPWILLPVTGFVLLWMTNLYNFMDGIDGLAGMQCVTFCAGAIVLGASGVERDLLVVAMGATLGFLVLNWAPAKIFMGDVASGFLGFFVGVVAVSLAIDGSVPFVASMILLTGFWFDASYTLCARILTRQNIAAPHRSHLYQKYARRFGHGWTTLAYLMMNVLWLLPLAWLADTQTDWSAVCLVVAPLPYLIGCIRARAGLPEAAP